MATYNVKEIDMDITKIDEFVRYFQEFCSVEQSIIKKHPIQIRLNDKHKAFEQCINELCVEHGENITILLLVYRDKLKNSLTALNIRLDYYIRYDGEKTTEYNSILKSLRMYCLICSKAVQYLNKLLELYDSQMESVHNNTSNSNITTQANNVYYTTAFSDKIVKNVFDYLINKEFLQPQTLLSDFIYFFTGRGAKKHDCLKWTSKKGGKVKLAYFINTIIKGGRDQDKSYWKKAEIIFGVKGLANSYSMSYSNNDNTSNEQFVEDIEKLLK